MAKLKQGIFGPISGKLGNLVGSTWLGIPYLKKTTDPLLGGLKVKDQPLYDFPKGRDTKR